MPFPAAITPIGSGNVIPSGAWNLDFTLRSNILIPIVTQANVSLTGTHGSGTANIPPPATPTLPHKRYGETKKGSMYLLLPSSEPAIPVRWQSILDGLSGYDPATIITDDPVTILDAPAKQPVERRCDYMMVGYFDPYSPHEYAQTNEVLKDIGLARPAYQQEWG